MQERARRLTRETLYEAVWSKATRRVAEDFGISDVALAKICRKLKIPKPGLGYWRKMETGSRPKRPQLPPLPPGGLAFVEINPALHGSKRSLPDGSPPTASHSYNFEDLIPKSLHGAHPAILKAKESIDRGVRIDSFGLNTNSHDPVIPVRLDRSSASRGLRFLEGLLNGLSQKGLALVRHKQTKVLGFGAGEDSLHFTLSDHTPRDKSEQTTGQFALKLEVDRCNFEGAEKRWMDCKRFRLEDRLLEMVEWISAGVQNVRRLRLVNEAEQRQRSEELKRLKEIEREQAEEEKRLQELVDKAEMWRRSTLLRSFIEACENEIRFVYANTTGVLRWLEWARACQRRNESGGNQVFGDMDLKTKFSFVLKSSGAFKCPKA